MSQDQKTQSDVAAFEGLVDALLDPADRNRKPVLVRNTHAQDGPRSDAFNAPTGNGGDRQRGGRRRGGQRGPDRGSHGGPAQS